MLGPGFGLPLLKGSQLRFAAGAARALQQAVFIRVANRTLENPYGAPQLEILWKWSYPKPKKKHEAVI